MLFIVIYCYLYLFIFDKKKVILSLSKKRRKRGERGKRGRKEGNLFHVVNDRIGCEKFG